MLHLLTDSRGQPLKQVTELIEAAAKAAGLPTGPSVPKAQRCVAHGLRKAALRRLAEAGASTKQIAAISGHQSLAMVELYTRAANQKKLAKSAIAKLRGA
jgi:integrase